MKMLFPLLIKLYIKVESQTIRIVVNIVMPKKILKYENSFKSRSLPVKLLGNTFVKVWNEVVISLSKSPPDKNRIAFKMTTVNGVSFSEILFFIREFTIAFRMNIVSSPLTKTEIKITMFVVILMDYYLRLKLHSKTAYQILHEE